MSLAAYKNFSQISLHFRRRNFALITFESADIFRNSIFAKRGGENQ